MLSTIDRFSVLIRTKVCVTLALKASRIDLKGRNDKWRPALRGAPRQPRATGVPLNSKSITFYESSRHRYRPPSRVTSQSRIGWLEASPPLPPRHLHLVGDVGTCRGYKTYSNCFRCR